MEMTEDIVICPLDGVSLLHPFVKRLVSPPELILQALGDAAAL
jgi:hypothetical protein